MLTGQMMAFPLTITHLWQRAREFFSQQEVVSRLPDKSLHRQTYADFAARTARLAHALTRLGVGPGDRVATLCWNHRQHLEAYYAVPMMGAVVHTLSLRLHPSELLYIARSAADTVLIVDRSLWKLYEAFGPQVESLRHVIVVPDTGPAPGETLDYESLLAAESAEYPWPALEENTAAMLCYTSGTTGNPKGVLYSHRSTVLHALVSCMTDTLSLRQSDTVLPVVPMFHASAWGLPYSAVLAGAKLVMPGPHLDAISLLDLIETEKVTVAAGVPTLWLGILAALDAAPTRWNLASVRSMIIGGSAAPASMIEGFATRHHLEVTHAWGMTETNPLGTVANVKHSLAGRSPEEQLHLRASQGYAVPFVETRHVNDQGLALPRDGHTFGELEVRGPWVAASYYSGDGADRFTADGWFKTGDVVTLDAEGYMRITDRAKDVIKSGGEWISSVALENALMSHPGVLEAAVFAAQHPTWTERPVAAVTFKPGQSATPEELRAHLEGRFAKFWLPDAYVVLAQIPRTSTGKFLKTKLREDHGDILLRPRATPG